MRQANFGVGEIGTTILREQVSVRGRRWYGWIERWLLTSQFLEPANSNYSAN